MIAILKQTKEIRNKYGVLHFKRFSIFSINGVGLFIHYFTQNDKEVHEHDHPWNFSTIILKGGYTEQHLGNFSDRKFLSYKKFDAEHPHRIHKLFGKYCITLAFIGKRIREWGYQTENGWIDHKTYRELKRNKKL